MNGLRNVQSIVAQFYIPPPVAITTIWLLRFNAHFTAFGWSKRNLLTLNICFMAERVRSSNFENWISIFAACFQNSKWLVVPVLDVKIEGGLVKAKESFGFSTTSISRVRLDFLSLDVRFSTLVAIPPKSVACTVAFCSFDRFLLPFAFTDVRQYAP